MGTKTGNGVTEALLDIDTDELAAQVERLKEEADQVSYKHSELLVELQGQDAYHADMEQKLKERLAWHTEQREKVATVMAKLGATTQSADGIVTEAARTSLLAARAADHDPDDHLPTGPAVVRKPRAKADGTVKSGCEELLKANVNGLTQEQVVDLFLAPKNKGGLEYETKSDKDTFGKTVYNSGLRPLSNEGTLIQMPTGGRNKLYIHRDNMAAYKENLKK